MRRAFGGSRFESMPLAAGRRGGGVRAVGGEAATANLGCRGACRAALPARAVVGCGGRLGGAVLGGTPRRSSSSSASRTLLPLSGSAAVQRRSLATGASSPACGAIRRWSTWAAAHCTIYEAIGASPGDFAPYMKQTAPAGQILTRFCAIYGAFPCLTSPVVANPLVSTRALWRQ